MRNSSNDRNGVVTTYLSQIGANPILSEAQERELTALLVTPDKATAVNKLVEMNLAFVVKVAAEFRSPALPFEDLINEGNVGLLEAARRFDHTRENRFITYAVWWIRRSILRALSRHSNLVRIPGYQLKKSRQVRTTERALAGKLGRRPDREEISRELQSTIAKVDELLLLRQKPLSIDDRTGPENDTPISDSLVDRESENAEQRLLREESEDLVRNALQTLSEQERTVIINRFGLGGEKTLTLREVGKRLGLTGERVRQIESQARKRLRILISRNRAIAPLARRASGHPPTPA